jgi:hypothetical protein
MFCKWLATYQKKLAIVRQKGCNVGDGFPQWNVGVKKTLGFCWTHSYEASTMLPPKKSFEHNAPVPSAHYRLTPM